MNDKVIRKGYGGGKGMEERTETVVNEEVNTGTSFIIGRSDGDINSIVKRLPYCKIGPGELNNQRWVQYGVFFLDLTGGSKKFKQILTSIVPSQKTDEFKSILLYGNVFDKLQDKETGLQKIREEFDEETYQKLWLLPRKYLNLVREIGKDKSLYNNLPEEEAKLGRTILKELNDIQVSKNYTPEQKNRLSHLVRNCGYIFNKDLVVGDGNLADIKIDLKGISKIQGLISESEGFGTLDWSNFGKYNTNLVHFIGRYDGENFTPLQYRMNKPELIDLENKMAQLSYLFFFGKEDLKAYDDLVASPEYITFLKPETKN